MHRNGKHVKEAPAARLGPRSRALIAALSLVTVAGCAGDSGPTVPEPTACDPALGDLWLLPFGPLAQEIQIGGQAQITTVVTHGSQKEGEGRPAAGQEVTFRIITLGGDSQLLSSSAVTAEDGLAEVVFQAGQTEEIYQVEASLGGLCPTTFTVDVRKPLLQLRAVTPSPFDTFTHARIPITVEATTNANGKLSGEDITFTVGVGKTGQTTLSTTGGDGGGDALTVTTNASGRATAMLTTGSTPIPQLEVTAAMAGTADALVVVRVAQGTTQPCQEDWECPLGYTCETGICQAPPVTPASGCQSDDDCADPMVCYLATNQCMYPTGAACDPIEGTGCEAGEVCAGGQCATLPDGCQDNSDCPPAWICKAGECVPSGQPPTGGCITKTDCAAGETCINGGCIPIEACAIQHDPARLQGSWQVESMLHFREAVSGLVGGMLSAAEALRDLLEGRFPLDLPDVLGFDLEDIVGDYLSKLLKKYIPPWGQELIVALGDISDIIDDMKVLSTLQLSSVGNDRYAANEQWTLVEFDYKGQQISTPPDVVPQIGQVKIPPYSATEVCGVLFLDKHQVNNVVGGLIKWAIDMALSLVTCNTGSACYGSIDQALQMVVNCQALAMQIDGLVKSIWSGAPSVATPVQKACDGQKDKLIQMLSSELNSLTTKLSLLELSGTATIPNPGSDTTLPDGKWSGVLGTGIAKGNFDGEFTAKR